VSWTDFPRLQPLLDIVWGLLQKGITGEEILQTFLSHGVQHLCQREAAVKVPLAPGCPICHPSSQSGGVEAYSCVQGAPALKDSAGQEAHRTCGEWLRLQWLKRRVGVSWGVCVRGPPAWRNCHMRP
jgi:hypothetical protein